MPNLKSYVGRIVRLKNKAFSEVADRARRQGRSLENCFLVATVSGASSRLTCYGASFRVDIPASEVVLI